MISTKKQLDRVQLTDTKVKVIMTEKVLSQIKYLCSKIAAVEWSGILYYSIDGSIKDPANLVCTLETILPMHKGTGSYTEYSFDERVVDFMMANDEVLDYKMAHIHSHNNMATFFSGTDMEELEDNAPNHNFYLSFIVNNRMDFEAKICFVAKNEEEVTVPFFAKDENGVAYQYNTHSIAKGREKLIIYNCDIQTPQSDLIKEDFIQATEKIIKDAVPTFSATTYGGTSAYTGFGRGAQQQSFTKATKAKSSIPKAPYTFISSKGKSRKVIPKNTNTNWRSWNNPLTSMVKGKEEESKEESEQDILEDFCKYILNNGNSAEGSFDDLEEVIEQYEAFNMSENAVANAVLTKYPNMFVQFFDKSGEVDSPGFFIETTTDVIEELDIESASVRSTYAVAVLDRTARALELMLENFIKNEQNG